MALPNSSFFSLPVNWEYSDYGNGDDAVDALVDEVWHNFAPFLANYELCWCGKWSPDPSKCIASTSSERAVNALAYPPPRNPFMPSSWEALVLSKDIEEFRFEFQWNTNHAPLKFAYNKHGCVVIIKAVHTNRSQLEIEVLNYLNSPALRTHPDNHTIPLIDQVNAHEWSFLVMPYWKLALDTWFYLKDVDDYFNLLTQAIQGLVFMHQNGVAHRDISPRNMVLSVRLEMVPNVCISLRSTPIALAFIDFGLSSRYPAGSDPASWESSDCVGTMRFVAPEVPRPADVNSGKQISPYKVELVDIHALGATFLKCFERMKEMYDQMRDPPPALMNSAPKVIHELVPQYFDLLCQMAHPDPKRRLNPRQALDRCQHIRQSIPPALRFAPAEGYPDLDTLRGFIHEDV